MAFNLIEELGLQALPEDRKFDLLQRITDLLMKRLTLRVLSSLSDEDRVRADELLREGKAEEAIQLFKEKVPGFENSLSEEMKILGQELKNELWK